MNRLLTIALVLAASLSAQTLADTFARMDKTAARLKSVSAGIRRDVHTAIINDDEIDAGTIKLKIEKSHGTRMLIDFTGKAAKTVALDSDTVSIYYPKSNTAEEYKVGSRKELVEQFLLLGFGASSAELKQSYDVAWAGVETVEGQNTDHLKLTPRSKDVAQKVPGAELWISEKEGLPVQQKIAFTNGDYWLVTYTDIKMNPALSDDSLKIKYPKGVQINRPQL